MCANKYRTILADPPWQQTMRGKYRVRPNTPAALPYPSMSVQDIAALPIRDIAADDCHLWLWTTNEFLCAGFDIMRSWGFKYLAPIHWIKPSGLGNWFIHRTQTCLFGYRRKCVFPNERYLPNIIETSIPSAHSAKPEATYRYIERVSAAPRIELFARPWTPIFPRRHGWDTWGNEVPCSIELGAQNTMESGSTATNNARNAIQASDMQSGCTASVA